MTLSEGQLAALRNLARKRAGHDVDWIRIGEAIALTDMGLATRSREGWDITPQGLEMIQALEPESCQPVQPPTDFRSRPTAD